MHEGQLNNLKILKPVRQALRNDATPAEQVLWGYLRGSQLGGRKFRRQHSVGFFVLDFYCPAERLAVELDGAVHDKPDARTYDEERQQAIESLGITVLRFPNDAVFRSVDQVLQTIQQQFKPD
ncbi:endonuclease domain-containing protein [Spirosoma fluminis]